MKEILSAALQDKSIISFCVGKVDWDKRIVGYIRSVNDNRVVINAVDIFGSILKSRTILIRNITVLEINDSYNKHLEKLKKQGNIIKKTKPFYYYNRGSSFYEKLERLCSQGNVCTIFFGPEYLTGLVKKVDETVLLIKSIGYRGTEEGESYCKLASITKIRYEGPLEAKIYYLLKHS